MTDELKKLGQLLHGIDIAMMTTVDEDGSLRSRPMWAIRDEFDQGLLWFFTHASGHKINEIENEHHIGLAFSAPNKQDYVSVSGRATLVKDPAKIDKFWSSAVKVWFPKGQDDPDLALLRVTIDQAEYWDAPSGTMLYLYGLAKATLTGEPPHPGGHGVVR
jgi:general stress protein 26